jgi:hypothetical protein
MLSTRSVSRMSAITGHVRNFSLPRFVDFLTIVQLQCAPTYRAAVAKGTIRRFVLTTSPLAADRRGRGLVVEP